MFIIGLLQRVTEIHDNNDFCSSYCSVYFQFFAERGSNVIQNMSGFNCQLIKFCLVIDYPAHDA